MGKPVSSELPTPDWSAYDAYFGERDRSFRPS